MVSIDAAHPNPAIHLNERNIKCNIMCAGFVFVVGQISQRPPGTDSVLITDSAVSMPDVLADTETRSMPCLDSSFVVPDGA